MNPFHPNAIRHNVQQATQPGNSRGNSFLDILLATAIAATLVWFVLGPLWAGAINWLAGAL